MLLPPSILRAAVLAGAAMLLGPAHAQSFSLGPASAFSALTFGDFTGTNGDTERALAVGGNATLSSWGVNTGQAAGWTAPGHAEAFALVVGGSLSGTDGSVAAPAGGAAASFVGAAATVAASFDPGTLVQGGPAPLDFAALRTQLLDTSAALRATAATGTATDAGGSTVLHGTGAAWEVFDIDGAELSANSFLSMQGVAAGATVVLNVGGADVGLASFGFDVGGADGLNLLFNFYEAATLSFDHVAIGGSVLAPLAAVSGESGHVEGNFVAASFASAGDGGFEFHRTSFTPASPVPEPGTWALMAAGLALLAAPRLRRRRGDAR